MPAATRLTASHAWINVPTGAVCALVGNETFELVAGLASLGDLAERPLAAVNAIKSRGIDAGKWTSHGVRPLPTWAHGCYPIQHQ